MLIDLMKKNTLCCVCICICLIIFIYWISTYIYSKNKFNNVNGNNNLNGNGNINGNSINVVGGMLKASNSSNSECKKDIPKMDEVIIRNMIDLPNRNPKLLTSSMVLPEVNKGDERKTRMDILNMFYNTFDDDLTSFSKRPRGLYLTP
jgi:hypothetical protein